MFIKALPSGKNTYWMNTKINTQILLMFDVQILSNPAYIQILLSLSPFYFDSVFNVKIRTSNAFACTNFYKVLQISARFKFRTI